MADPLAGCFERLDHASDEINTLQNDIAAFFEAHDYRIDIEPYRRAARWFEYTAHELILHDLSGLPNIRTNSGLFAIALLTQYSRVVLKVDIEPPLIEWGVAIGEIVHNIRSSLDNLTWALSEAYSGASPPYPIPRGSPWRQVAFPICRDAHAWISSGKRNVQLVRPSLETHFERLQPYYGRKRPERHWLWMLQELWNSDKHRTVSLTETFVGFQSIEFRPAPDDPMTVEEFEQKTETTLFKGRRVIGPLSTETELGRIKFGFKSPYRDFAGVNVQVESHLKGDVFFEQGAPTYGRHVIKTLRLLRERSMAVLKDFEQSEFS